MTRLLIPIGLTLLLAVYLLYLWLIKKDRKMFKAFLYPGLAFVGVWVIIYWWLLQ